MAHARTGGLCAFGALDTKRADEPENTERQPEIVCAVVETILHGTILTRECTDLCYVSSRTVREGLAPLTLGAVAVSAFGARCFQDRVAPALGSPPRAVFARWGGGALAGAEASFRSKQRIRRKHGPPVLAREAATSPPRRARHPG